MTCAKCAERAVYDEQVLCREIELLIALGDRAGAAREFESFARRLSTDLGLNPSKQTKEMLNRLPHPLSDEEEAIPAQ